MKELKLLIIESEIESEHEFLESEKNYDFAEDYVYEENTTEEGRREYIKDLFDEWFFEDCEVL